MAFGSGPSLGAVLLGESTAGHVVERARAAERAGLDSLWFIEDYFQTGAFAVAGAAAAVTTRLGLGLGGLGGLHLGRRGEVIVQGGLDPRARVELRRLLVDLRAMGKTRDALVYDRHGDDVVRKRGDIGMHSLRIGDEEEVFVHRDEVRLRRGGEEVPGVGAHQHLRGRAAADDRRDGREPRHLVLPLPHPGTRG